MQYCVRLSIFTAFMLVLGCGGSDDIAQVSGRVTLDGEPVEGAALQFIPKAGTAVMRPAFGRTDKDGNYFAAMSDSLKGAPVGTCVVQIATDVVASWKGKEYEGPELFPPKYRSVDHVFVIKKGDNTLDFACESGSYNARASRGY